MHFEKSDSKKKSFVQAEGRDGLADTPPKQGHRIEDPLKTNDVSIRSANATPASCAHSTYSSDTSLRRSIFVVPIAACLTVGLTLTMASLISVEFVPQDEAEAMAFDINPLEAELPPLDDIAPPELLRDVIVPPPPPVLDIDTVTKVVVNDTDFGGDIVPDLPGGFNFDIAVGEIIVADTDAEPIVRIPPVFPPRFSQGAHSGYCKVRFDVSAEGQPFNVRTTFCTSSQIETATVKSVQKWKYKPKIQGGRPVARSGVESKIRFDLSDERGKLLPLPKGG